MGKMPSKLKPVHITNILSYHFNKAHQHKTSYENYLP